MSCGTLTYIGIFVAGLVPSYLLAGRGPHSAWRRIGAAVVVPALFLFIALHMPTYEPGQNRDDWRRGVFLGLAAISAVLSAGVQVAIVIGRLLVRRLSR